MPNLGKFANLARKASFVPPVPHSPISSGTEGHGRKNHINQSHNTSVPHVPRVPSQTDSGWDQEDWQAVFDERAAILEYDAGMTRGDAEAVARREIAERRASL